MNIEEKIQWLENELKELKEEVQKEENKNTWVPKLHDRCYSIDDVGNTWDWCWFDIEKDKALLSIGNVFKTRAEADWMSERLRVINELKQFSRPFVVGEENYFMYYSSGDGELDISSYKNARHADIYFESEGMVQKAIEHIGEDRVKKYYLGVEDDDRVESYCI